MSKEGKLRLGRPLREKLPQFIQVGFDANAMVLAIADSDADWVDSLDGRIDLGKD